MQPRRNGLPLAICAHNAVCSACSAFALASVYMPLAFWHAVDATRLRG